MLQDVEYANLQAHDDGYVELIAAWYKAEWNIPLQTTTQKLRNLSVHTREFQVLMSVSDVPIATGGIYNHVSLLDKEPRLRKYEHWLTLVYTVSEFRRKGAGAELCNYIGQHAQTLGLKQIHLCTHTAERLYKRLGWQELERLWTGEKEIVIMQKNL